MPLIVSQYHDHNEIYERREVGSSRNLGPAVPIVSHSSQARLVINELNCYSCTVSQIVQFCTHVLGIERNFNMLVSKDGEIVQCGSDKSHWPFRGWIEATGCCGTLRCETEYHIQTNCGSDTGIHMT